MSKWQPHLLLIRGCVWASALSSAQLNGIIRVARHRRYVLISVSNEFGYLLIFSLYVSLLFNCFVICVYCALSNCNIGCSGKSEGTVWHSLSLKIRYFILPTYQQHSVCTPGKPSSSFQGTVKNYSEGSPASLSYQKIWLNNPKGFGIKWWELPELQPLFSQPENSTVHTSQRYRGQELEFLYRAQQAHLSLLKTHGTGRNLPFPGPTTCSPWVLPSCGNPQTAVLKVLEIRDGQHGKSSDHSLNAIAYSNCTKPIPIFHGL